MALHDRRLALASVLVSGAVGIAVPIFTVALTNRHDDARLRQELVRSDRAELRVVLDESMALLNSTQNKLLRKSPLPAEEIGKLNESYSRLIIRLGPNSAVTRAYRDASLEAVVVNAAPGRDSKAMRRLSRYADDYRQGAFAVGRSTLK